MAVTIFEDLVLRERGDPLLEVAVPQRQQRALVVEEGNARGQRRHLRLRNNPRPVKFADIFFFFILGEIQLEMLAGCRIQHASFFWQEIGSKCIIIQHGCSWQELGSKCKFSTVVLGKSSAQNA